MNQPIRIAGVSGALGDDPQAFGRAVRGEPVDVIIGDYLAEITMGGVAARYVGPQFAGKLQEFYCDIFLRQLEPELGEIARRGIRIVVNAGAFAPVALAEAVRRMVRSAGLDLQVAAVHGDDLLPQLATIRAAGEIAHLEGRGSFPARPTSILAANAYLGGWGIAAALQAGADIVICGRVTDASLVVGPAAWWHEWAHDAWDALAGALVAGHIIECGAQSLGGNFSGFLDHPRPVRLGYSIAEIEADGQCVITKPSNESGHVTRDTVIAQLLYEIQGHDYLNPDVILHVDTVGLSDDGPDRIRISGVRGSPPPATTKLSCYWHDGYRQVIHSYVTGRSITEKVHWLRRQLEPVVAQLPLDAFCLDLLGTVPADPSSLAAATAAVRIAAAAPDEGTLHRLMGAYFAINLGSFPGIHGDYGTIQPRIEYWPGLVRQAIVPHRVTLDDGSVLEIRPPAHGEAAPEPRHPAALLAPAWPAEGGRHPAPLGEVLHARSGDKGGNASLGVWCRHPEAWPWLAEYLTPQQLGRLLATPEGMEIERYELPEVSGVLFVLRDYFGRSGTGNVALDQIGKSLGEFLLARVVDLPNSLLQPAGRPNWTTP